MRRDLKGSRSRPRAHFQLPSISKKRVGPAHRPVEVRAFIRAFVHKLLGGFVRQNAVGFRRRRASVARHGCSREKRRIPAEPVGYELGEKPHALGLARLPWVSSQSVPCKCRSLPGALTSRGSASPMKHGKVVIPSPCRTAAIWASPSVVLNGTPAVRTSPREPNRGPHSC